MLHFSYSQLYALVDGVDEYIGDCLTRKKYCGLLGDIVHYRRIKKEYQDNPLVAIIAIIGMKYQARDIIAEISPQCAVMISKSMTLESMLAIIKSSVYWKSPKSKNKPKRNYYEQEN